MRLRDRVRAICRWPGHVVGLPDAKCRECADHMALYAELLDASVRQRAACAKCSPHLVDIKYGRLELCDACWRELAVLTRKPTAHAEVRKLAEKAARHVQTRTLPDDWAEKLAKDVADADD